MTADRPAPPEGALDRILNSADPKTSFHAADLPAARAELAELREARDKAQREIRWALMEYRDEHAELEAEIASAGVPAPDVVVAVGKSRGYLVAANKIAKRRGEERDALRATVERLERANAGWIRDWEAIAEAAGEKPDIMVTSLRGRIVNKWAECERLERERDEVCKAAGVEPGAKALVTAVSWLRRGVGEWRAAHKTTTELAESLYDRALAAESRAAELQGEVDAERAGSRKAKAELHRRVDAAEQEVERLRAVQVQLLTFYRLEVAEQAYADLDCATWENAVSAGCLVKVPYDPSEHHDEEWGSEPGDDWYVPSPEIEAALEAIELPAARASGAGEG